MREYEDRFVELGRRLAAARDKKGLNQAQVARDLKIDRSNLVQIEQGAKNPTTATLYKLADHYGVKLGRLIPD
ncbi:hypothetical protein AXK56_22580 [Tsukamurella pulmonis]|nr:helix-turn-helix transcriptional regulator [Tsukamurella pulmonis]KXO92794.1 hypothetical protein AXK56_22580 [Tsukamurella pulmonis]